MSFYRCGGGSDLTVLMGQFGRNMSEGYNWSPLKDSSVVSPTAIGAEWSDILVDLFAIPWANTGDGFDIRIYRLAKQYSKIRVRMYYYSRDNPMGTTTFTSANCDTTVVTDNTSGRVYDVTYDVTNMSGDYAQLKLTGMGSADWGGVAVISAS